MKLLQIAFIVISLCCSSLVNAERIKDIAGIAGVRSNQLIGYGLVVGLDGTGMRCARQVKSPPTNWL